eukprot:GHVO01004825.1.p1 GENE.GHVO01004825.1~~GHVO01004825.1.p1  ORF type:complete len:188 (-),score=31.25 GHVO01004825.1:129-692(-)
MTVSQTLTNMHDEVLFLKRDTLSVIAMALCGALFSEIVAWLVVCRTESFKASKAEGDKIADKIDMMKQTTSATSTKIKTQEELLTAKQSKLTGPRFKAAIVSSLLYMIVVPSMNSLFDGIVVAKLPFTPIWMFKRLAHRTLGGDDYTDCSMTFLYFLAVATFRTNFQQLFGFAAVKRTSSKSMIPGF